MAQVRTNGSVPEADNCVAQVRTNACPKASARKRGAQPGNRNAFKTGFYSNENRALRSQIAALMRRTNIAVAEVEKRLPKRKPGPKPGSKRRAK